MPDVVWTDERVELIKRLWADGLAAGAIANKLACGASRNAVIGKLHRLGLRRGQPAGGQPVKRGRPRVEPSMPAVSGTAATAPLPPAPTGDFRKSLPFRDIVEVVDTAAPTLSPEPTVNVADQKLWGKWPSNTCRWVLQPGRIDPNQQLFCGEVVVAGSAYCKGHFSRVYAAQRTPAQEKAAAEFGARARARLAGRRP